MKRMYTALVVLVIAITLAVFGYYLTKRFFGGYDKRNSIGKKENVKPEAPKETVFINEQFNSIFAKNTDKIINNYSDDVEIDWQGAPLEGKYFGKEQAREFWQKFFENAILTSSDSHDFQAGDKIASAAFSVKKMTGNKLEVIERNYTAQFNDQGKISKETWSVTK